MGMAAPSKKRGVVDDHLVDEEEDSEGIEEEFDENDDDDLEVDEHEEGQEFINQEVTVEFEARTLDDSDFHGVRKLLSQLFLKANIDLSEMTDTIISQNYIGSAIKQVEIDEEDEDTGMDVDDEDDVGQVFGIISVLNITERKNLNSVKQLKSLLLDRCSKGTQKDKLAAILNDGKNQVGFIINERFINIPAQIAVPSFETLWKEVEQANKKKMNYNFSHFLMLSKVCKMSVPGPNGKEEIATFINAEEEFFVEAAEVRCEYSVKSEHDSVVQGQWDEDDQEMDPFRTVVLIPVQAMDGITAKMKHSFG